MKMKKFLILLCVCAMFLLPSNVFGAGPGSHSSTGFIYLYSNDVGLLASITITTGSGIGYSEWTDGSGLNYDSIYSDASALTNTSSYYQCGGTMAVRNYTSFGGNTINLPTTSYYIYDPSVTMVGKNSGGYTLGYGPKPYSASVSNVGYFSPSPTKCYGGGSVTDSWTYASQ
jgi:hypothetical protein